MKNIYAVLDIGGAMIKLLVGEVVSAHINVLYVKKIVNKGVKKNKIEDLNILTEQIKSLIEDASVSLDTKITDVALCIPSNHARLYSDEGIVKVNGDVIHSDDIVRALRASTKFKRSEDEEIISVIPTKYYLDTKIMDESPIGISSSSLKVDSLVITTKREYIYPYIIAVENAGYHVLELSVDCYTAAKEVFDIAYLKEGAILIDIGYRSSTISFFEDGYLKYIAKANVGGYSLTKAIAIKWQIPMEKAELYKIRYGTCVESIGNEDIIHINQLNDTKQIYTQKDMSNVLNEAVEAMMKVIQNKVQAIDDGRKLETVIVGGGGEIPDIERVASKVLDSVVRTYRPDTIGARDMSLCAGLGMMYYLNDRSNIVGDIHSSLSLPDISNTMSIRLKGLTAVKPQEEKKHKIGNLIDTIFSEE